MRSFFSLKEYTVKSLLLLVFSCFFLSQQSTAQELNVSVQVDKSRLNSSTIGYLDNMASEIQLYLNEHDWIEPNFLEHEKINASLQITLLNIDSNFNFEADVVIRSLRPVYNTNRQTTVFLYNDEDWFFNYTPNRGFVHDKLQFDSFTTFLDFYAFLILGFDFDTFSELGGDPYFTEANNLASIAQASNSAGWSRTGATRRNRAQLITDLINPNYESFRQALYVYHRLGIDQFINNPAEARRQVIRSLEMIQEAMQNTTSNLLFDFFFDAKHREIVSIFEDAQTDIRLEAFNLLAEIDQSHLTEYRKLQ